MMESTNASRNQAIRFLLISNYDIDEAVNNFFDSGEEPQGNTEIQDNQAYSNSSNTKQGQQSHNSNNQQQHLMQQQNQIQTQKLLQNHFTQQRGVNQQTTTAPTSKNQQSQYRYLQLVSEKNLQQFMDISNCSNNQALKYFKHSNQTVEEALNMFYESGEAPENAQQVEDNYELDYAVALSLQQQIQEDQQFRTNNSYYNQQLENEQIQQMMESTNTSREQAIYFLQNSNYDINIAINNFFDSGEDPTWKPKQQQIKQKQIQERKQKEVVDLNAYNYQFLRFVVKKPQNAIQILQENNINFRQGNITKISDIQHELQIIVQKMNFDKVNQIMAEYIKNEKLYNLPNKPPKQQIQAPIQEIQQENKKNDFETLQFVVQNAQNAVQVLKQNKIHFVQGTTSKINNFQEKIVIYVYQIASIDQVYEIMDQFIQNEYLQQSQINKAKLIQNQQQNQVKPKSHPQKPAHSSTLTQTQNFNVQTAPETELKSEIKVEPKTEEESVSIVIENSSVSISIDLEDS
ncbi:UBA-like_superfamily [Hexamita inflata]|uniref:UBA-like superfamily n=1 Tax=Hexamita inflata TaxID=28002 RepID=A0AA86NIH4_9EUKA|nr:UBA-like superfamily [Hexamita inflata]